MEIHSGFPSSNMKLDVLQMVHSAGSEKALGMRPSMGLLCDHDRLHLNLLRTQFPSILFYLFIYFEMESCSDAPTGVQWHRLGNSASQFRVIFLPQPPE